ncbi:peptidase dimerization domain-containing protein [Halegenticoccus tardaugens]|uniref:peptidase dimerization domain-containing protein n=1 Tax=Halegenticoccus tardaugens TaxID=2071624 RepID=UPI00100BBF37|nr:peptidase dimerization domain-containing protein [Halegenticoccus tardaugens]
MLRSLTREGGPSWPVSTKHSHSSRFDITFEGKSAHAGFALNIGRNTVQALVTAASNIYGVPCHAEESTRVSVGELWSDNAADVIANHATANLEIRGDETELMEYMRESVYRCPNSAAEMHDCSVDISVIGEVIR